MARRAAGGPRRRLSPTDGRSPRWRPGDGCASSAPGFAAPELQVEIRTAGRLVAVVDAWFEDAAVAVEFDGG